MAGQIVEIDGVKGLWVVVGIKSRENVGDCCYDRDYFVAPYSPTLDELEVDLSKTMRIEVKYVAKNPVKERTDIMPYTKYGDSDIRGVKKVYFERIWPTVPTR